MNKAIVVTLLLLACFACTKKSANQPATAGNPSSGTMTTTDSKTANASTGTRDLSGTWTVKQGGDTWELVVTRTGDGTYSGSSTLTATDDPNGLYGPPGSKGDDIVIVSDGPGKFRVRWAKAENFHKAEFWEGTGTYDDNTFNFGGVYIGKRKS